MGIGPVPATERLFARTGLGWDDIDAIAATLERHADLDAMLALAQRAGGQRQ